MITAMTAPMAQGKLYEIDMRLRPSGNQGPVATSLASFESYQKTEAWVWEHLALTRASVVAGPEDLGADVTTLCAEVLAMPSVADKVLAEVGHMRSRIGAAKAPSGIWDAKIGPGRLQDIELLAQAGALIAGQAAHSIPQAIRLGQEAGIFDAKAAETLTGAYDLCWRLQCASRLLSAGPLDGETLGQAGASFMARTLGCDSIAAAETQMTQTYAAAAAVISSALSMGGEA